ncbi:MAG: alpha/beta hydrolase fold domain-containing protein, partial [Gemmataceae bacterium]
MTWRCRFLVLVLLPGLLASSLRAESLPAVDQYGERVVIKKDIPFSKEGQPQQKLDLYLPRGDGPFPLVVCWFGGGFTGGKKDSMARVCAFLADKGLAAAAPGYYLANPKEDKPGWPQNVNDAKCAVRFLKANAKMYHLDPDRFAGLGHSSGAYLALMTGLTPGLKDLEGKGGWAEASSSLAAIVNIAGVCDRRAGLGTGTQSLLGKGYQDKPELRKLASPVVHITKSSPPVYTLHGEEDKTVLPDSARQLDAALKVAGVEHELQLMPKLGHNPIAVETMTPLAAWLAAKLQKEVEQLPVNTWIEVKPEFQLPATPRDARWLTGDGFSDSVYRSKTGTILIRTGIDSKEVGYSPGFYTNTTVEWDLKTDKARVLEISNWGGGSYTPGRLLPAFKEQVTPMPRHTYDGICYVEDEDAVYMMLGAHGRSFRKDFDDATKEAYSQDVQSTWKLDLATGRWTRIPESVRKHWNENACSPYESHLQHWRAGNKLLFLNDRANHAAEFDLKTQKWEKVETKNETPMSLYNARSTWNSKRDL